MRKTIQNWGLYPSIQANEFSFQSLKQTKDFLEGNKHFIARGMGRCYGDASLSENIISTHKFNRFLSFDSENGVLEGQSGVSFEEILNLVVPRGWFLPVTPGTKFITLGGAVASDVHGKNHHLNGSFSNHILDLKLLNGNNQVIECSPYMNPDLFNATCGGMGLTGLILSVRFQLIKIETSFIKQKQIKARDLDEAISLFDQYQDYHYSVAWIDCLKRGKGFGRSILILGDHAQKEELPKKFKKNPLTLNAKGSYTIPFFFPQFILNQFSVKSFNWFYYHKNLKKDLDSIVHYNPFFYPLDAILHWNRMYGKNGFVQYQFVLPLEKSKLGLKEILNEISRKKYGSFLSVLKLFGEQESLISFPMKGYTLALDFAIRPGLFDFLDTLDKIVLAQGGRIYLSKDARMKAEIFHGSYKNLPEFVRILKESNAIDRYESNLSKRLNIN